MLTYKKVQLAKKIENFVEEVNNSHFGVTLSYVGELDGKFFVKIEGSTYSEKFYIDFNEDFHKSDVSDSKCDSDLGAIWVLWRKL